MKDLLDSEDEERDKLFELMMEELLDSKNEKKDETLEPD